MNVPFLLNTREARTDIGLMANEITANQLQ